MSSEQNSDQLNRVIDYYQNHAEDFVNRTINLDMSNLYDRFLPKLPLGAKILDAGCGSGRDSLHFRKLGYDISAFDASSVLATFASEKLGLPVRHLSFHEMDYVDEFHGIWCCASLLHLPDQELEDAFLKLNRALKSDGLCFQSFKSKAPASDSRYFNILDLEKLVSRLDDCGYFKIIEAWESEDVRPNQQSEVWVNVIVSKKTDLP
jgi:SAM-dependent methyltransferase